MVALEPVTGTASFSADEIDIRGLSCMASVQVRADVFHPTREDDGFHRGEVGRDYESRTLKSYTLFVGGEQLPDWLQEMAIREIEDELIDAVMSRQFESDVDHALLSSVGQ